LEVYQATEENYGAGNVPLFHEKGRYLLAALYKLSDDQLGLLINKLQQQ